MSGSQNKHGVGLDRTNAEKRKPAYESGFKPEINIAQSQRANVRRIAASGYLLVLAIQVGELFE